MNSMRLLRGILRYEASACELRCKYITIVVLYWQLSIHVMDTTHQLKDKDVKINPLKAQ